MKSMTASKLKQVKTSIIKNIYSSSFSILTSSKCLRKQWNSEGVVLKWGSGTLMTYLALYRITFIINVLMYAKIYGPRFNRFGATAKRKF